MVSATVSSLPLITDRVRLSALPTQIIFLSTIRPLKLAGKEKPD